MLSEDCKTRLVEDVEEEEGRIRTGTLWTGITHAITAVIGSGILALPWSVAQMGWIFGPFCLVIFAYITYYASVLLSDCYRSPDSVYGHRNTTYTRVVRSWLGPRDVLVCGIVQYITLWGTLIGYTVTTDLSMMSLESANWTKNVESCTPRGSKYIVIFGLIQMVLSQIPSLQKVTSLSVTAAVMSFTYSIVGLYFCVVKFVSQSGDVRGSMFGPKIDDLHGLTTTTRTFHSFQALGNIAFAFTYAILLIEVQDTLKSPPAENKTMKKASRYGIGITTVFYMFIGCIGYAAFGNDVPGNILTGFKNPFWLVDIANIAVVIHMVGAYQVFGQLLFAKHDNWAKSMWPESRFVHNMCTVRVPFVSIEFAPCSLALRAGFVALTTTIAIGIPFFNAILGLMGSITFWPITVYYPVAMYMVRANITWGQPKWLALQSLSILAFLVTVFSAVGSFADVIHQLRLLD